MKYIIIIFLLTSIVSSSQIDTSTYYPLHIGNKWEYDDGTRNFQVEIIGDTVMENGHRYFIFSNGVFAWRFQRMEGDKRVIAYNYVDGTEYLLFDFVRSAG